MRTVYYFNRNISRIATNLADFEERFNLYADFVYQISPKTSPSITLLLGGINTSATNKRLFIRKLPRNAVLQILFIIHILRRSARPKTLILGDNDLSLILGWIASRFVKDVKLQISLHASVDHILHPVGIISRIRKQIFFWSLSRVQSIRMVSKTDIKRLETLLPDFGPEVILAPIPIKIPLDEVNTLTKKKIAFIGRIHYERGLQDFIEIMSLLSQGNGDSHILVVGDGPKLDWFRKEVSTFTSNAEFKGGLNQEEVQRLWPEVRILVSCALTESYGLTLREALLNGSFVVARANPTTLEIESKFPNQFKTYRTPREAVVEIEKFRIAAFDIVDVGHYRRQLLEEQQSFLMNLARSWVV